MTGITVASYYHQAIQAALDSIVADLDGALDYRRLAEAAALSPFYFHRIFRGMVGETALELVRRLRLERAAWQLAHGKAGVTSIAFVAGYEAHEAFTRAFRSAYGCSPSAFRRRASSRIEIASISGIHYHPSGTSAVLSPKDSGGRTMDVEIVEIPAQRVATVRHLGAYNQINRAFATLGEIAGPAGLFGLADAKMVALYHDDPESTAVDQLRSDAGLVVPDGIAIPANLGDQRIPAGRYARTVHLGPYQRLGDAWARFMGEWLPASGHRVSGGVSFERYLNTPMEVAPEALRTELYLPIS